MEDGESELAASATRLSPRSVATSLKGEKISRRRLARPDLLTRTERRERILVLYVLEHHPAQAIAARLRISRTTVYQDLKELGFKHGTAGTRLPAEKLVLRLSEEGWSGGAIARKTGLSRSTVYQLRHAQGIKGRVSPGRNVSPDEHARRVQLAARLKEMDWNNHEIGRELRCSQVHVAQYLAESGSTRLGTKALTDQLGPYELTLSQACDKFGVDHHWLRARIESEALPARKVEGAGLGRNGFAYVLQRTDVEELIDSLPTCAYGGCERRVFSGESGGCRDHHRGLEMKGKRHSAVTRKRMSLSRMGHSVSAATRAKLAETSRRWCATPEFRDPALRLKASTKRWGHKGGEYIDRAFAAFHGEMERRKGGARRKTDLHLRWLNLDEGADPELESLLANDEVGDRRRLAVLLDWQRHPEDWPRPKWFSQSGDPESLAEVLMPGALDRFRKGLQSARKKPLLP